MKQFEFKVVSHEPGVGTRLKGDDFGDEFKKVLAEQGLEGWDLKALVREHGMRTLLIFSRELRSAER